MLGLPCRSRSCNSSRKSEALNTPRLSSPSLSLTRIPQQLASLLVRSIPHTAQKWSSTAEDPLAPAAVLSLLVGLLPSLLIGLVGYLPKGLLGRTPGRCTKQEASQGSSGYLLTSLNCGLLPGLIYSQRYMIALPVPMLRKV